MARPSKPWFREGKNTWYCTIQGKKISLGVKGKDNREAALQAWHTLHANGPKKPQPENVCVGEVLTAFLADRETYVEDNTIRTYRFLLLPFVAAYGSLLVSKLTCPLVEAYSRKPEWTPTTRNDFLTQLATAFRWAERARLIERTPLLGLRRPPRMSRGAETLITPEEHACLLAHATPQFALVLEILWSVGCRPGEAAAITVENFDADAGLVTLAKHKTSYKGKRRILYLPPETVALLSEQGKRYPSGPLLRNRCGRPWTSWAIVKAMQACRKRAGLPGKVAYGLRHSFATDALERGVPDAMVAELLGHSGTAMLHKHYSHLAARRQALHDAVRQVRRPSPT
jgi:integrase